MKRKSDCEDYREEVHMEKLKKYEEVATIWEARKIMTGRKILHSSVSQYI